MTSTARLPAILLTLLLSTTAHAQSAPEGWELVENSSDETRRHLHNTSLSTLRSRTIALSPQDLARFQHHQTAQLRSRGATQVHPPKPLKLANNTRATLSVWKIEQGQETFRLYLLDIPRNGDLLQITATFLATEDYNAQALEKDLLQYASSH